MQYIVCGLEQNALTRTWKPEGNQKVGRPQNNKENCGERKSSTWLEVMERSHGVCQRQTRVEGQRHGLVCNWDRGGLGEAWVR